MYYNFYDGFIVNCAKCNIKGIKYNVYFISFDNISFLSKLNILKCNFCHNVLFFYGSRTYCYNEQVIELNTYM